MKFRETTAGHTPTPHHTTAMAASELYARANEAFVDDNYDQALALYDQAIELEPDNAGYLVKRAACHMKYVS